MAKREDLVDVEGTLRKSKNPSVNMALSAYERKMFQMYLAHKKPETADAAANDLDSNSLRYLFSIFSGE